MNTNTKMMIHLLVTTIAPLVVWGLLHLAEVQAESQHLELAPTLRGGFLRVGIAYITGIVYIVLLVMWFVKYRSVSWGMRLLPLLPLVLFVGIRTTKNLMHESENRNYSAQTFLEEYASVISEYYYEEREDGQMAVRVDSYLSELNNKYAVAQLNRDIPSDRMEQIVAESLPVIMGRLEQEPLCEPDSEKKGAFIAITMDSWSYDPTTHQLSVTYSSRPEPKLYEIDIR